MVNAAACRGRRVLLMRLNALIWYGVPEISVMSATVSTAGLSRPLLFVALGGALILAATLALWAYYGTAVFFEVVRAGWTACF